ncbi:protein kinase domain-containing protein [Streptomyces sp. NBC_00005]|uniref:protein kinase domain-containing protein n=1 Tax=Streptomyces sp. NBC_00005 TaxID=2903609 RepID=UPI0032477865
MAGEAGEATPVWEPGDVVLGLYEVLDVVHSGGMGLVHRVRHRGWQVDLAVKTPRPDLVRTPDGLGRFETEAGTWVGLGLHPHTVNCVYVRTVDGAPRVFAEWVDGGSLAQAVRSGSLYEEGHRAALGRILDIAIQMAWGLEYAHASGLVHQDVKPANVMLEPDGTAKVTDFGLAGARAADEELTAQRPREDPGTVSFRGRTRAYCSPEQAAAAAGHRTTRLTTATDVWSWAVSVLEMFTGRLPTRYGQLAGEVLENFLREGGADDARVPAVPPTVAALLRQCFAKDPADRPSGLGEPAATLRDVYREALGTDHQRPAPKAAQLLSDGLSNQALSLLDLGRTEDAEELWRRAVAADPHRLPTVYNFGLHRWRSGKCTGEEVVSDLEAARTADTDAPAGLGALLLGSVQLERHENERAGELLREAVAADPDSTDAAAALAEWERRPPPIRADLDGHTGPVSAVAVSADGNRALAGDRAGGLLLWTPGERQRRRVRRTLTRRGLPVDVVAMDAAGALGVTVRRDGIVELWDLDRARRGVGLPHGDGGPAVSAAVSGDGRYVATGHQDGLIRVWETERGQLVTAWQGHLGTITSLALSRDGRRALSASFGDGGRDGKVRTWDVAGRRCVATLTGPMRGTLHGEPVHTSPMDMAAVSPDARCAVVAWWEGPLTLWDARQGTVVSEVPHHLRHVMSMAVASAGPVFLTVQDWGDPTQVWHAPTGRSLRTLDPPAGRVYATAVSADGHVAVLGRGHGWSRSGQLGQVTVRSIPAPDYHAPWCYARPRPARELTTAADVFGELMDRAHDLTEQGRFAPAADVLRSAQEVPGFARHPRLRGTWAEVGARGRRSTMFGAWPLYTYDGHGEFTQPTTLALREDGAIAATGRWTGEVDVWNFPDGERLHTFDHGEGGSARDIQFALQGNLLAVRTTRGTIRQLSLEDGSKRLFTDETGPASTFALTPAGDRILIGDETGTLQLRNLPAGQILRTLRAHGGKVGAVALSSDGRYAASHGGTHPQANHFGRPSNENEVHLWTPDSDRPAWTLTSRTSRERPDFSADGQTLFLSSNMFVTAWDVATGTFRYSIRTMGTFIGSSLGHPIVVFSADRRYAASPGDKALNVWETATGQVLHSLPLPLPGLFRSFALSADATFAVTGGTDRLVRVWEVSSGRCLRTLDGHRTAVSHTLLSRNGALLATGDLGSGLAAWELAWDFDFPPADGG